MQHHAAFQSLDDLVGLLLERKANKEARDVQRRRSPLHLAAMNGHDSVVKLLLSAGAEVDAEDGGYLTPLCYASIKVGLFR